jgi:S1-C subfamily serine protease
VETLEAVNAMVTAMLQENARPRVVAPAGLWGFVPAKAEDDREPGVTVRDVFPDGPAAAAGLRPGDRLLTLDGRWTDSVADTFHAARHVQPGTAARVTVRRDGKEQALSITPRPGL